ncbi:hypothetical protein PPROV_000071000 [Pycnococcus provasolii]|uniref:Uncharacterized protein n=1 Tax=Pycnococcus provasolii TaxID=41880 RepID=A0A830H4I7_9CHLO|nr:hypothetical protein PPROV_000071000 [Pycnococcus provasolii]
MIWNWLRFSFRPRFPVGEGSIFYLFHVRIIMMAAPFPLSSYARATSRLLSGRSHIGIEMMELWKEPLPLRLDAKWTPAPFLVRLAILFGGDSHGSESSVTFQKCLLAARDDVCTRIDGIDANSQPTSAASVASLVRVLAPEIHDVNAFMPGQEDAQTRIGELVDDVVHGHECEQTILDMHGVSDAWRMHFAENAKRTPEANDAATSVEIWEYAVALRSQFVTRFVLSFMQRVIKATS